MEILPVDTFEWPSLYVKREAAPGKVTVTLRARGEWLGWLVRSL